MTTPLTHAAIQTLAEIHRASPAALDVSVPDIGPGSVAGLAVRIQRRRAGAALTLRWVCRRRVHGGAPVRVALGDALLVSRADARRNALAALQALAAGDNPHTQRRVADAEREARRAAARDWLDVLRVYADPGPHAPQRPATLSERRLVLRWFERAVAERRAGTVHQGVRALAALAQADVGRLSDPAASAALLADLWPLLSAPEQAPAGATSSDPTRWGPLRSRASLLKLLRVCTAAWNADRTLPRTANPWTAWRHDNARRLQPPPPRERQLLFPLSPADARAERNGPAGRWLRALVKVRSGALTSTQRAQADWLLCCVFWGCRATEAALLTWGDVVLDGTRTPHVVFRASTTKVGQVGHRPLLPLARAVLLARRPARADSSAWVFPGAQTARAARQRVRDGEAVAGLPRDAEHWHAATPTPLLEAVVRAADPSAARAHDARVQRAEASCHAHTDSPLWTTPHDLRRSIAGWVLAQAGLPAQAAALVLDHAVHGTTAGYQQHREQRLRAQIPTYARWEAVLAVLAPRLPGAHAT